MYDKIAKVLIISGFVAIDIGMIVLGVVKVHGIPYQIKKVQLFREQSILTQCQYSKELTSVCYFLHTDKRYFKIFDNYMDHKRIGGEQNKIKVETGVEVYQHFFNIAYENKWQDYSEMI